VDGVGDNLLKMALIINPGSENKGGTTTQANINAEKWLKSIHEEGFPEVTMEFIGKSDGSFVFDFTHATTKVKVQLVTHGFTDEEAAAFVFRPRVYWNGSSTADPKIEDWLTDEYDYHIQYIKKGK